MSEITDELLRRLERASTAPLELTADSSSLEELRAAAGMILPGGASEPRDCHRVVRADGRRLTRATVFSGGWRRG